MDYWSSGVMELWSTGLMSRRDRHSSNSRFLYSKVRDDLCVNDMADVFVCFFLSTAVVI